MSSRPQILSFTADDENELRHLAAVVSTELRDPTLAARHEPEPRVAGGPARLIARGATVEEIATGLVAFASGDRTPTVNAYVRTSDPNIAFIFAGQSETRAGMGQELYRESACYAEIVDRCSAAMGETLESTLASALYDSEYSSLLDDARLAQPALFALQLGLVALWAEWGVTPDAVAGHSLGEYAAASIAGVMSLDDGIRLVAARGALTQSLALPGLMAVIFASEQWVKAALVGREADISIAAVNAPGVVVVSGRAEQITTLLTDADSEGMSVKALKISHPFHSCCIDPILPGLEEAAANTALTEPRIPFASTLEGRLLSPPKALDARYWRRHARESVQFLATMRELERAGCTIFLEIGPHATLTGLGERCVPPEVAQWLPSLKRSGHDWRVLADTAIRLWLAGIDVDLAAMAKSLRWTHLRCQAPAGSTGDHETG